MKRAGGDLGDLIADLEEPAEEKEVRLGITAPDFKGYGAEMIALVESKAAACADVQIADDSYEGTKIIFADPEINGFFIFRLSVHDPIIPINFESAVAGGNRKMAKALLNWLSGADGLNLAPLQQFSEDFAK